MFLFLLFFFQVSVSVHASASPRITENDSPFNQVVEINANICEIVGECKFLAGLNFGRNAHIVFNMPTGYISGEMNLDNNILMLHEQLTLANLNIIGNAHWMLESHFLKLRKNIRMHGNWSFGQKNYITLDGNLEAAGVWNFDRPEGKSFVVGNGNQINCQSLQFCVGFRHKLRLANLSLHNITSQTFYLEDSTSQIEFENCQLHFSSNFFLEKGRMTFLGQGANYLFFAKQDRFGWNDVYARVVANRATLFVSYKRNLANLENLLFLNGAKIVSLATLSQKQPTRSEFDNQSEVLLTRTLVQKPIDVKYGTQIYDGKGFGFFFDPLPSKVQINLAKQTQLIMQNVNVYDFDTAQVQRGVDSQLLLADNVYLTCDKDLILDSKQNLKSTGKNVSIDMQDNNLILKDDNSLVITSERIVLKNAIIQPLTRSAIKLNAAQSTLCLYNCRMILPAVGVEFTQGNIEWKGIGYLINQNVSPVNFDWNSTGTFTIVSFSSLGVKDNIQFSLGRNAGNNLNIDASSTMCLQNCKLILAEGDWNFNTGVCQVWGQVTMAGMKNVQRIKVNYDAKMVCLEKANLILDNISLYLM